MQASYLFKKNIETLLTARGQSKHDLAAWCRRSDAWLSKILGKDDRNLPMKYLDRIASFFGIAAYQLFQPGISPLTERRAGSERRRTPDRRIGVGVLSEKPGDTDLMSLIRALSTRGRQRAIGYLVDLVNDELRGPRNRGSDDGGSGPPLGTPKARRARKPKE